MLNSDSSASLEACLLEIERYAGRFGWDQPARLFALVPTAELLASSPELADQITENSPGSFSSVEQEDFHSSTDLFSDLINLTWPSAVKGCALVTVRAFLSSEYEGQIPEDPAQAADFVTNHPERQDLRIVAGALRDGTSICIARLRKQPEEILHGDLVPALTAVLKQTLN